MTRYDDMLATVLARPAGNAATRAAAWRQLSDILAFAPRPDSADAGAAFAVLRELRGKVPAGLRAETARSLRGMTASPELLAFYREDTPAIAALIADAVPFAAPGEAEAPAAPAESPEQDDGEPDAEPARLVWPFQARRAVADADAMLPEREAGGPLQNFRFESDAEGILVWTDAAPRGALIGYSLAAPAGRDGEGVDGQAAGAFRHRAPFRDARLALLGAGPAAGEWRLSAVPFFDHADGRFLGYRGTGRRPRRDESAAPPVSGPFGGALPADALRQLVHELRTPLNAVAGFAEMIDGQLLGPAASAYRVRASQIVGEARRLLRAVDDLDIAARIESDRIGLEPGPVDAGALLGALGAEYGAVAEERGAELAVAAGEGLWAEADAMALDRMFARLLGASVGLAASGERIAVQLSGEGGEVALRVARPAIVAGRDETTLLDPGYTPEGDWPEAPLLGLGFTLRLVRNLAAAAGGRLELSADSFLLALPAADGARNRGEGKG